MFALWMSFGPPSLLFTLSPCDECCFRMHLYTTPTPIELPTIHNSVEILSKDLRVRKELRVKYPGSCAREFDSLLQIVIGDLIGWEGNKQVHDGIFGKVLAISAGIEEQGKTSLHGHLILWIKNYHNLQQQLFSTDAVVRKEATIAIESYLSNVLSSTFNIKKEKLNDCIHANVNNCPSLSSNESIHGVPFQQLREMRHREFLKSHGGKIIICNNCNKSCTSTDVYHFLYSMNNWSCYVFDISMTLRKYLMKKKTYVNC